MIERKPHLLEAMRWSASREVGTVEIAAAAIGMAAPVAVGAAAGHLALGLAASVGGLLIGDVAPASTVGEHGRWLAGALAPALLAAVAATFAAGHGWLTDVVVVLLATTAAILGGYSRGLAVAAMRFVLALVLTVHAAESAVSAPAAGMLFVALGAIGAAAVSVALAVLPWRGRARRPGAEPASTATAAQKYARWKRLLRQRAGWQYPLRLGGSLAVAALVRLLWPAHHLHWVALVVAILTQRQVEPLAVKTTQRALGTLVGVVAASALVVYQPSVWGLVLVVGVLAGLRPLLKARSYIAYTAAVTPLILLLMSAAHPIGAGVLLDRLIATLLGAGLVIGANRLAACWLASPCQRAGAGNRGSTASSADSAAVR